jgi:hypothetical protein
VDAQSELVSIGALGIIRVCILMAVALLFVVSVWLPVSNRAEGLAKIEIIVALVALWSLSSVFYFRRKYVVKAEVLLRERPGDRSAAKRMGVGYLAIYATSFGIALYGILLHLLGAPVSHVDPFLAVGAALILWSRPKARYDKRG